MGTKYDIFLIKGTASELKEKLFSAIPSTIDVTSLSIKEREWQYRKVISKEDYEKEPEPDLADYLKNSHKNFAVWWMNHPKNKNYILGGYTTFWIRAGECQAVFYAILKKAGITECLNMNYTSVVCDGDIQKIFLENTIHRKNYDHNENEECHFNRYIKRIEKLVGYPVISTHKYLDDYTVHFVQWEYCVEFSEETIIRLTEKLPNSRKKQNGKIK